ncbi:MAG: response regulator [Chloroflexota bacterium]|nr:response regulator [Chloroflexota bacterium]
MKKILLIEDESLIRSSLARALCMEGVVISEAQNCKEALEKLRNDGCDLAIVDLFLEDGMHGLKLIHEVHEQSPGAKIIVVTAFGTEEVKDAALKEKVDRFYDKPFEIMEIKNAVRELLQGIEQ